jgi:hypothetical protein
MRSFVLDIIVIDLCSARGFPLEEASEHFYHNKVALPGDYSGVILILFWINHYYFVISC